MVYFDLSGFATEFAFIMLARAPALLDKVREGRAALDALAAKARKGPNAAD
jgi:hypothetical protein